MKKALVALAVVTFALASVPADAGSNVFVGAGYVWPADVDGTAYVTGGIRIKAGPVAIEPEVGYWKKSEGVEDLVRISLSDLSFGANLVFAPDLTGKVGVYFGAGAALHRLKLTGTLIGISESASENKFGAQGFAGIDFKLSDPVWLFATGRYDYVTKVKGLDLSLSGFKVYGGLRINF